MPDWNSLSIEDNIRAAQAGDAVALEALCKSVGYVAYRAFRSRFHDEQTVEDLVQDLLEWLVKALLQITNPGGFQALLFHRIFSMSMTFLRQKYRRKQLPLDEDDFPSPEEAHRDKGISRMEDEEEFEVNRMRLHDALEKLPPSYREIVNLHFFNDLTYAEIASRLQISAVLAKKRGQRAVNLLKIYF